MKFRILALFCIVASSLMAQNNGQAKTVFGNGKPHLGFYISPFGQVGRMAGSTALLPGLAAGVMFNEKLSVGLSYKFIATENSPVGETDDRLYLDQFYAGVKAEYTIFPTSIVHLNVQLEAGLGHTELDLKDSYEIESGVVPTGDASFGYIEPGAAIEINLWKYLKLDLGAAYRLTNDFVFRSVEGKDLRGLCYTAALKIGLF